MPEPQPQPQPLLVGSGPTAELVRDCPSFQLGFTPAPLLSSPHAQTLYGVAREPAERLRRRLFSGAGGASSSHSSSSPSASGSSLNSGGSWSFRRQLVHCEDGGTIALDWWEEQRPKQKKPKAKRRGAPSPPPASRTFASPSPSSSPPPLPQNAPILLVLHGLTGGSKEGYVKSLCDHGTSRGFRAAAVVYRGCGGLRLTSARAYSATFTADVSRAAQQARSEFPLASSLVAVGFSLGAIILSKYIGEQDAGYWHHGRSGGGGRESGGREEGRGGGESGGEEEENKKKKRKHFLHSPHQGHNGGGGGGLAGNDDLIDAAVAVSSPFCLESAGARLSRPWTGEFRVFNFLSGFLEEHLR